MRILFLIALLAAACSDDASTPWAFDETEQEEPTDPEPDAGIAVDSGEPNNGEPACPSRFDITASATLPGSPMSRGRTLVRFPGGMGSQVESRIRTLDGPDADPALFEFDAGEVMVGSGGGRILTVSADGIGPTRAYDLFANNLPAQLLDTSDRRFVYPFGDGYLAIDQLVDRQGHAVFLGNGSIYMWDTVEIFPVAPVEPYAVEIGGGTVGWLARDEGFTVGRWRASLLEERTRTDDPRNLEVAADGLFWVEVDQNVVAWQEGEPRTIYTGAECGGLAYDSAEGDLYFQCDEGVLRWDGATVSTIVEADGRQRFALTAHNGVVAWAEYEEPGPPGAEGELHFWSAGNATSQVIAPIGLGCLACGAYWAPVEIELGVGVVAYSYANQFENPTSDGTEDFVGVLWFGETCE